jgi:hypothetical protein
MESIAELILKSREFGKVMDYIDHRSTIQMSLIPNCLLRKNTYLTSSELRTLLYLMSHNWYNFSSCKTKGFVFLSKSKMCEELDLHPTTIYDSLNSLENKGIIFRLSKSDVGYDESIEYIKKNWNNVYIKNTTIVFIDFTSLLTRQELCSYLEIPVEEIEDFLMSRENFILQLRQIQYCNSKLEHQNMLSDLYLGHLKYENPYVSNIQKKLDATPIGSREIPTTNEKEVLPQSKCSREVPTEPKKVSREVPTRKLVEQTLDPASSNGSREESSSLNNKTNINNEILKKITVDPNGINGASPTQSSSSNKANYFRNLKGVVKEDVSLHNDPKKKLALEKKQREEERQAERQKKQQELLTKLQNKDFNSFTSDQFYMYFVDKVNKEFNPATPFRSSEEKAKEFQNKLSGVMVAEKLNNEQAVNLIDTYILMYKNNEIKGQDLKKFPLPLPNFMFPVIQQVLIKMSNKPNPKGFDPDPYRDADSKKENDAFKDEARAALLKWAQDSGLSMGGKKIEDHEQDNYVQCFMRRDFSDYGVNNCYRMLKILLSQGLLSDEIIEKLLSWDKEFLIPFIVEKIIPHYLVYERTLSELNLKYKKIYSL